MKTNINAPSWYTVVSVVLLLWNIMGLFAFYTDMMVSPEALEAMPEKIRELYLNAPTWTRVAYGVAVFMGTIGCIGLVMKKKWALPLLIISFIAVLLQQYYYIFVVTDAYETMGDGNYIMPTLIILISAFLIWFANKGVQNRWLT